VNWNEISLRTSPSLDGHRLQRLVWKLGLGLGVLTILAACGTANDKVSFVDQLRSHGVTVDSLGDVVFPPGRILTPRSSAGQSLPARPIWQGKRLSISGGNITQPAEIELYEDNDARVELGAGGKTLVVQSSNGEQSIDLGDPPIPMHVFRKGQRLVVYFGTDQSVLRLLTDMFGPQIVGQ
jgi:hypothetical protein